MGILADTFGMDKGAEIAKRALGQKRRLYGDIQVPELEWLDYTPEEMVYESYDADLIQEDPRFMNRQLSNLEALRGLAETGFSDMDKAAVERAMDSANQRAKQDRLAAIQNAQARGVAGGGMEFALREIANQEASDRARKQAFDAAEASSRARANAQLAYGNQLGNVRSQDYRTRAANADIINRMNQMNTAGRNQARQYGTQQRNFAQQYNQQGRTGTQQQNYGNQMDRARLMAGMVDQQNQIDQVRNQQNLNRFSALGQMVGAGVGAMYGGPAGAQAGGQMGGAIF